MYDRALFIFRRDYRLHDNTGLIYALKHAKEVLPCFIFTPEQIENNEYRSDHCLQFMLECLEDLEEQLSKKGGKLYLFYGNPATIVAKCIRELGIDLVVANYDYTPYSILRDEEIKVTCEKSGIEFQLFHDLLIHHPEETLKSDGSPYKIFTAFYKQASLLPVQQPHDNKHTNYSTLKVHFAEDRNIYARILPHRVKENASHGGRSEVLKILKGIKEFENYLAERDFPALDATTHLSPHLKFTTCSSREAYYTIKEALGLNHELIWELFWRDFFTCIGYFFPYVFGASFQNKYDTIKWNYDKKAFDKWCEGKTGVPIVDAGMRQMSKSGYMHNRVRMLTASFLTKDLHIDWRWGEKYFAQMLIDYDPAVNNGNWQWVAGTGCDAQPYFRIFNPWSQQKKFDPDCIYIKKWIPELQELTPKMIHQWYLQENNSLCPDYPLPMVDHALEAKRSLELYKLC